MSVILLCHFGLVHTRFVDFLLHLPNRFEDICWQLGRILPRLIHAKEDFRAAWLRKGYLPSGMQSPRQKSNPILVLEFLLFHCEGLLIDR